jgi:hypothetical protein
MGGQGDVFRRPPHRYFYFNEALASSIAGPLGLPVHSAIVELSMD